MALTSSNSSNYLAGAAEVNNISSNLYNVARQTGVNTNQLVEAEIKTRANRFKAKTDAEEKVGKQDLKINSILKSNEIDAKAKKDVEKIMKPARMAGALAQTVDLGNMGLIMHQDKKRLDMENAETKRIQAEEDLKQEERDRKTAELYRKINESLTSGDKPTSSTGGTPEKTEGTSSTTSTNTTSTTLKPLAGSTKLPKSSIRQLAIDQGFTPEDAGIVVGIAGGESGYDPTNSTIRSGLYKREGEDSVGLMQINWGFHKDSGWLQSLGINKREDLFDPVKNMKAAKYLHSGSGGFSDWTVYDKGIYKDYM